MATVEARLAELEAKVRRLEDELAVRRVMDAYGLAADSADAERVADKFTKDGVYEVTGLRTMEGHQALKDMINGRGHQALMPNSAHIFGPAIVKIDGDKAVLVGYTRLYHHQGEDNKLARLSYARVELEREGGRWRIKRRTNRLVGSRETQDLFKEGLAELDK